MGKVIALASVALSLYGCGGGNLTSEQAMGLSQAFGAVGQQMQTWTPPQPAYAPPAPPTFTTCQRTTMGIQCVTR